MNPKSNNPDPNAGKNPLEYEFITPEPGYIPPFNETIYIQGKVMDDLKIRVFQKEIPMLLGLSEIEELKDSAFELDFLGIGPNKFLQWRITRLTKEEFAKKWGLEMSDMVMPEDLPDSIPKKHASGPRYPFKKKMDMSKVMEDLEKNKGE